MSPSYASTCDVFFSVGCESVNVCRRLIQIQRQWLIWDIGGNMQAHRQNAADASILHLKLAQPRWKLLGKSPTVENWCGITFIQRSSHAFSSNLQKNTQGDWGGSLFFISTRAESWERYLLPIRHPNWFLDWQTVKGEKTTNMQPDVICHLGDSGISELSSLPVVNPAKTVRKSEFKPCVFGVGLLSQSNFFRAVVRGRPNTPMETSDVNVLRALGPFR